MSDHCASMKYHRQGKYRSKQETERCARTLNSTCCFYFDGLHQCLGNASIFVVVVVDVQMSMREQKLIRPTDEIGQQRVDVREKIGPVVTTRDTK